MHLLHTLHTTAGVLLFGLVFLGCRAPAPRPTASSSAPTPAAPMPSFEGVGPTEAKQAFKDILLKAIAPRVTAVDTIDETHYRYRASGFLGRTDTISVYLMRIGRVDVTKRTWAFVYDRDGRRIEKVKFQTVEEANHYKALVEYVAGPEYGKLAEEDKQARLAAQKAPPAPEPAKPAQDSPCAICGEPRGDTTPCPHCGME